MSPFTLRKTLIKKPPPCIVCINYDLEFAILVENLSLVRRDYWQTKEGWLHLSRGFDTGTSSFHIILNSLKLWGFLIFLENSFCFSILLSGYKSKYLLNSKPKPACIFEPKFYFLSAQLAPLKHHSSSLFSYYYLFHRLNPTHFLWFFSRPVCSASSTSATRPVLPARPKSAHRGSKLS